MAMFLIVGCQTIEAQLPEETKPEETKSVAKVEKTDTDNKPNPLADDEIPEGILLQSHKPILCGRMDSMLSRVQENYNERPVVFGHAENTSQFTGETIHTIVTLTYNSETGTYTFFEQLPTDDRIICILSGGKAKFKLEVSGIRS